MDLVPYKPGQSEKDVKKQYGRDFFVKLASNENPLGPSPFAIKEMTQGLWDLHRYPDSHGFQLKNKLAEYWDLSKENIIEPSSSFGR